MTLLDIGLAKESDEQSLRECLKSNEMSGAISVAFESEPNFFDAIAVQGRKTQVMACKNEDGKIIGLGTRAIKPVFVNGEVRDIGYLSGLRINPEFRHSSILSRGYKFLRELNGDGKAPFYLTTIIEDNVTARNILESGRANLPKYTPLDVLSTSVIKPRKIKYRNDHEVVRAKKLSLEEIVDFMNTYGKDKQFFPYYNKSDFGTPKLRGLSQDDFYVAVDGSEILGIIAKWDQESFKQTRVTNYDLKMKVARPLINLASRFSRIPNLPNAGELLHYFYASFPTIKNNNPLVLKSLLNAVASDPENQGYDYFMIGLTKSDPLNEAVKRFKPRKYQAVVYVVSFEDKKEDLNLSRRIPYIEAATL